MRRQIANPSVTLAVTLPPLRRHPWTTLLHRHLLPISFAVTLRRPLFHSHPPSVTLRRPFLHCHRLPVSFAVSPSLSALSATLCLPPLRHPSPSSPPPSPSFITLCLLLRRHPSPPSPPPPSSLLIHNSSATLMITPLRSSSVVGVVILLVPSATDVTLAASLNVALFHSYPPPSVYTRSDDEPSVPRPLPSPSETQTARLGVLFAIARFTYFCFLFFACVCQTRSCTFLPYTGFPGYLRRLNELFSRLQLA